MTEVKESGLSEELKFFADYIEKELGIIYDERNAFQLENRLNEIRKVLDFPSITDVYQKAKTGGLIGHFKQLVLDIATNNETQFFRDKNVFNYLETILLPELLKNDKETLKIWSLACSYGQEPYSLAFMIDKLNTKGKKVEILATDIADRVLEKASEGRFSQLEVQRGLPITMLTKYFQKGEDNFWFVVDEIKSKVKFQKFNLLDMSGVFGKFDLILCRNVLIYQNSDRKKEILQNLCEYMHKDSHLLLGASESLIGIDINLKQNLVDKVVTYMLKEW